MSSMEVVGKIEALREWEALASEAAQMVESIRDELKRHMDALGTEELVAGTHILRWTTITSNRLDTTALKKENNALYLRYLRQVTSRRFTVSD